MQYFHVGVGRLLYEQNKYDDNICAGETIYLLLIIVDVAARVKAFGVVAIFDEWNMVCCS